MPIAMIRKWTPAQICAAIEDFEPRYAQDFEIWLQTGSEGRPRRFGQILRRWQATRPLPMRRPKNEAKHGPPFLDNLLEAAAEPLRVVAGCSVLTIVERTPEQTEAFEKLWDVFSQLPLSGKASCVSITKALLLLTEGRIGPALDSQVRGQLGVAGNLDCLEWLRILEEIAEDIAAFEHLHGPIAEAVSVRFAKLAYGRLYDMALGPRRKVSSQ